MKILKSYGYGLKRATVEPKMVCVLWLANIFFSSALFFLVSKYLNTALGHSLAAQNMLHELDFNTISELLIHNGGALQMILYAAFLLVCLYILVSFFLNGGILFVISQSRKIRAQEEFNPAWRKFASVFFQGAGQFFGRFFRLGLFSLILWAAVILINLLLHFALKPLTAGGTNEKLMFYLVLVRAAVALFFVLLTAMILDYARIKIVLDDSRSALYSLFHATGFVFQKMGKTLLLYLLLCVTGLAVFAIYWYAEKWIIASSFMLILAAFGVGQLFILSRGWLRIAFLASQLNFMDSHPST